MSKNELVEIEPTNCSLHRK